jgi:hypothetical protein
MYSLLIKSPYKQHATEDQQYLDEEKQGLVRKFYGKLVSRTTSKMQRFSISWTDDGFAIVAN